MFPAEAPSHLERDDRFGPFVYGGRLLYLIVAVGLGCVLLYHPAVRDLGPWRALVLVACVLVGSGLALWTPLGLDPLGALAVWLTDRLTPALAVWRPADAPPDLDDGVATRTEEEGTQW